MRIPKEWIAPLSRRIVDALVKEELLTSDVDMAVLLREVEAVITEELMVEDKINDEVRQMLLKFDFDISRGKLDYRKLFDLTKQKIVKERNVVI